VAYYCNRNDVFSEIGGGLQSGQFYNNIRTNIGQGRCSENSDSYYTLYRDNLIKNNFTMGGLSLARAENLSLYRGTKYGVNLSFGEDKETGVDTAYNKTLPFITAQPYFTYNTRYFGLTAVILLGTFHFADILTKDETLQLGETVNEVKRQHIYPSATLRVGPINVIYLEGFLANHFPSGAPLMQYGLSLGSGLGRVDGTNISTGITPQLNYNGNGNIPALMFLKASVPIKQNYFIDAFYGYSPYEYLPAQGNKSTTTISQFSIGMRYRFNYKTVPVVHKSKSTQNQ
jgi:hypothetical protein